MGRLIRCLPIWAIAITCTLAINTASPQLQQQANNGPRQERWSRQIDQGFQGPTVNSRPPTGEDWIPINPNNDRSGNGRVLNFGPQQPLFAAQSQHVYQHPPPPQFLMQTQFIPPTFPGNDLRAGPIQQSQPQFMTLFGEHRFGGLSQIPQQPAQQSPRSPSKPKNSPFQFEFTANNHKSPLFQQLSPQFVNEQFFDNNNQGPLKNKPAFESKFNTESFNQKPKKPTQELFHHPPPPLQHQQQQQQPLSSPSAPSGPQIQQLQQLSAQPQQQEEVQLLYVPAETYYQQQQQQQQIQQNSVYQNPLNQFINPNHINNFYTPQPNVRPLTIQTTTSAPRLQSPAKPKAHQPPLSLFMLQDTKFSRGITVNDLLDTLRRERAIAVLDAITADQQPNVFIGPGGLNTPVGYQKFELPYLSAIDQTRSERKLDSYPFFVAPLSYQTPNGFTKIPLPHPHVGSIVLNDQKMIQQFGQFGQQSLPSSTARPDFLSPVTKQYSSNFIAAPTPMPQKFDPLTRKYVNQPTTESYRQFTEEQFLKETPATLPKQSFVYQRPTLGESGTKIVNEDFFSLKKVKPPTLTFENLATFRPQLQQHQNQGPSSAFDVFQQSVKSHTANHFDTTTRAPTTKQVTQIKEFLPQTTPATYNTFSATPNVVENYQFSTPSSIPQKNNNQYHEEFRSSTAASVDNFSQREPQNHFEYTPISQEIPSSKPKKVVHKFQFGQNVQPEPTPSAYPTETTRNEPQPTIPSRDVHFFNHQVVQQYDQPGPHSPTPVSPSLAPEPTPSDVTFYNRETNRPYETQGPHEQSVISEEPKSTIPPSNLDFYNNNQNANNVFQNHQYHQQQHFTNDLPYAEIQTTTEQYRLPSELPPINANLPNMINGLMEEMEEAQRAHAEAEAVTNPPSTRRPVNRGRRPAQRGTTSTTENNEDDQVTTTRRPIVHRQRTRPPVTQQEQTQPQTRQHYRTSTIVRNPNRVRFNPSNEERSELKRNRGKPGSKNEEGNDKNLEYQRDVLNQNYPVINKGASSSSTTSTTEAVQFVPEVETQNQQFAYTPRDNVVTVMAESYPNFDYTAQSTPSTYFGQNQEEPQQPQFNQGGDNLAQKVEEEERLVYNSVRNNVEQEQPQSPVETVTKPQEERVVLIGEKPLRRRIPTTTTEAPQTTIEPQQSTIAGILRNRRPAFVRRVITRTTTTTETPTAATTVSGATQERFTARSRTRGDGVTTPRNVPQIRGRLRQRTTTTQAPETADTENEETPVQRKPVYRAQYRGRQRPKFQETQETQETSWSLNHNAADSFQPLDNIDYITRKYDIIDSDDLVDNEPEIITADPNAQETFIFTVTPKNQAPAGQSEDTSSPSANDDTESSNEISPRFTATKEDTATVETTTEKKAGKRRGIWRRVKVRPADGFETAESQHISQPAYNVLPDEYQTKYDSKAAYNSFTKGFFGPSQQDIETASALTMEKEAEIVTEALETLQDEEEVPTTVPEAKIVATEDQEKQFLFESTTIIPEIEEEKQSSSTTESLMDAPMSTTESIYDEVRKSLSELFSREPEEEEIGTDLPAAAEEKVEKEITTSAPSTTTPEQSTVAFEEKKQDESTEVAHVVELSTEPEIKANVTEINRSFVIATSTSQQVSHETEICYRGRCIKSIKKN